METGVTVKVYGLEDVKKQAEAVREKMSELNRELGKLACAMRVTAEINQSLEESDEGIDNG